VAWEAAGQAKQREEDVKVTTAIKLKRPLRKGTCALDVTGGRCKPVSRHRGNGMMGEIYWVWTVGDESLSG
jgi:hypothetical protein